MNTKAYSVLRKGGALFVLILAAVFGAVSCLGPAGIQISAASGSSAVLNLGGAESEGYPLILEPGPNGTVARPQQDPVRKGYSFGGWFADETHTVPFDFPGTIVTDTTVIYAKWDKIIRIVRFFSNYGSGEEVEYPRQEVPDRGYAVWPALPVRPNYGFAGWYTDAAGTAPFAFGEEVREDKTLYAKWGAPGSFAVWYVLWAGGEVRREVVPSNNTVTENEVVQPGPRPGYTFAGWYETQDCTGDPWTGGPIQANKTVYGKWTAPDCTVSFDGNGGQPASFPSLTVPYGERVNPPSQALFRGGYFFTGWYTEAEGGSPVNFDGPVTSDRTYYARWKRLYTVTLARLATGQIQSRTVEEGDDFTLPDKTGLGWTGIGEVAWYQDAGYTEEYSEPSISPVTKNTTLYAQLDPTCKITLVRLATGQTYEPPNVVRGQPYALPGSIVGWSGTGLTWYTDAGHTIPAGSVITAEDAVFFGRFAEDVSGQPGHYFVITLVLPPPPLDIDDPDTWYPEDVRKSFFYPGTFPNKYFTAGELGLTIPQGKVLKWYQARENQDTYLQKYPDGSFLAGSEVRYTYRLYHDYANPNASLTNKTTLFYGVFE